VVVEVEGQVVISGYLKRKCRAVPRLYSTTISTMLSALTTQAMTTMLRRVVSFPRDFETEYVSITDATAAPLPSLCCVSAVVVSNPVIYEV